MRFLVNRGAKDPKRITRFIFFQRTTMSLIQMSNNYTDRRSINQRRRVARTWHRENRNLLSPPGKRKANALYITINCS